MNILLMFFSWVKQLGFCVSRISFIPLSLALGLTSLHAQTAPPSNWWVHIANDRPAQVQALLKSGVDPNAFGSDGLPAAMYAVTENAWKVYDMLISQPQTNIHQENAGHESLLMYLALLGDEARIKTLIQKGAAVNRLGWTPLMYAASTGKTGAVKLLLDNGAILNAQGPQGESALMMAALGDHEPVVRQLLAAGADSTVRDLAGQDAADWARKKQNTKLAQQLDDLVQRVLAQREAQRNPQQAVVAPVSPEPSKPKAKEPETSGNQQYFDLKRFE